MKTNILRRAVAFALVLSSALILCSGSAYARGWDSKGAWNGTDEELMAELRRTFPALLGGPNSNFTQTVVEQEVSGGAFSVQREEPKKVVFSAYEVTHADDVEEHGDPYVTAGIAIDAEWDAWAPEDLFVFRGLANALIHEYGDESSPMSAMSKIRVQTDITATQVTADWDWSVTYPWGASASGSPSPTQKVYTRVHDPAEDVTSSWRLQMRDSRNKLKRSILDKFTNAKFEVSSYANIRNASGGIDVHYSIAAMDWDLVYTQP